MTGHSADGQWDESVDALLESLAVSMGLAPGEPAPIDRIIERLSGSPVEFKADRDSLERIARERRYTGSNHTVMLSLYDILGPDSDFGMEYGIRAIEAFGRDPKKIAALHSPDRLVEYVIATADGATDEGLEELVKLKDALLHEGSFRLSRWERQNSRYRNDQTLIPSVVLVAGEIASLLKDFDMRNAPDFGTPEFIAYGEKWVMRWKAHAAIVLAYQAQGDNPANPEAMEALAVYESLTGSYDAPGFEHGLMKAHFKIKYGADKPVTGEVPEELKADVNVMGQLNLHHTMDDFYRAIYFGTKKPAWKIHAEQEKQEQARQARAEALIDEMFSDPWTRCENELRILGINKEYSHEAARAAYRRGVFSHRETFVRMDVGTPEYAAAMKETAAFISAWKKLEPLYDAKSNQEAATANA